MGVYKGSKLGAAALLVHILVLRTVSDPTQYSQPFATQKSANYISPTKMCVMVSTVHFCYLFSYFFLIPPFTPSPACKGLY